MAVSEPLRGSLEDWIAQEVSECQWLDRVAWDLSVAVVPGPQGMQPVWVLLLATRSPVLGEHLVVPTVVGAVVPAEEAFREAVRSGLGQLGALRDEVLSQSNGKPVV